MAEVIPPTKAPVAAAPAVPPAAQGAPLKEGDLVGPGEGVVEPRIVRLGSFKLPPQARQIQMKQGSREQGLGTPIIMALVTEKGAVAEARVLRPSAYSFVDEAAIQALKSGQIEPATKNGIRVKMWKAFPITVRP
ncbi:TonB family protein [Acidobacteria bacterium ACD]|nr:TonB family protein [Acidobacteria bacterium ACD]